MRAFRQARSALAVGNEPQQKRGAHGPFRAGARMKAVAANGVPGLEGRCRSGFLDFTVFEDFINL